MMKKIKLKDLLKEGKRDSNGWIKHGVVVTLNPKKFKDTHFPNGYKGKVIDSWAADSHNDEYANPEYKVSIKNQTIYADKTHEDQIWKTIIVDDYDISNP